MRWDISENSAERFPARMRVTALNEPGTLATIAEVIGTADGNIDNLQMLGRGRDFTEIEIDLEVWNLKHLNRIMTGLREKRVVSQADPRERLSGSRAEMLFKQPAGGDDLAALQAVALAARQLAPLRRSIS